MKALAGIIIVAILLFGCSNSSPTRSSPPVKVMEKGVGNFDGFYKGDLREEFPAKTKKTKLEITITNSGISVKLGHKTLPINGFSSTDSSIWFWGRDSRGPHDVFYGIVKDDTISGIVYASRVFTTGGIPASWEVVRKRKI